MLIASTKDTFERYSPVIVNNESNSLEQDGVLGVGVLYLLGFGRFLGFVENRLQTLHQTAFNSTILRWWVALQEPQQLTGQPRSRNEVICVVLQVSGRRRHDLNDREMCLINHTALRLCKRTLERRHTLLRRDTARDTHVLNSSGFFWLRQVMREMAAVTTPWNTNKRKGQKNRC